MVSPTALNDEELKSIKCPTLLVVGENERIYSLSKAIVRLERIAPRIKKEIIPHAGHVTIMNSHLTNEKILGFLKKKEIE